MAVWIASRIQHRHCRDDLFCVMNMTLWKIIFIFHSVLSNLTCLPVRIFILGNHLVAVLSLLTSWVTTRSEYLRKNFHLLFTWEYDFFCLFYKFPATKITSQFVLILIFVLFTSLFFLLNSLNILKHFLEFSF